MSQLSKVYAGLKPSIVAIVSTISKTPDMPDIIGTGFIARSDGLIVTNNHVIEAIRKLPRRKDAKEDEWPIKVMFLKSIPDKGMASAFFDVDGVTSMKRIAPVQGTTYGPDLPDVGFIFVKVKDLPAVTLQKEFDLEEGDDVFIAGYPMGTDTLRAPGWVHQIGPTLQHGIISAIQPFPCPHPHGILVHAMTQGGSSGSPIFNEAGTVVALLYAGLVERGRINLRAGYLPYTYGTSLTLGIPAYIISDLLKNEMYDRKTDTVVERDISSYPTLDEFFASHEMKVRDPKGPSPDVEVVPPENLILPGRT